MGSFRKANIPTTEKAFDAISPPPKGTPCGCCEAPMVVLHVWVMTPTGEIRSGTWSDFAVIDANGSATKHLRTGYVFRSWVPRCAKHYTADVLRHQGKIQAAQAMTELFPLQPDERVDYVEVAKNLSRMPRRRSAENGKKGLWTQQHEAIFQAQCAFLGLDVTPLQAA